MQSSPHNSYESPHLEHTMGLLITFSKYLPNYAIYSKQRIPKIISKFIMITNYGVIMIIHYQSYLVHQLVIYQYN